MSEAQGEGDPRDFEGLLKELTQVVEKLERGNLPLEESIGLYSRGVGLLKGAKGVLDAAEARLEVLMAGPDGQPRTTELDPNDFLEERR
jgi:exodeoxyribonuclease VII small subunit